MASLPSEPWEKAYVAQVIRQAFVGRGQKNQRCRPNANRREESCVRCVAGYLEQEGQQVSVPSLRLY